MKLRIKGSSVRLRVLRPEVSRLIETGSIEEKVYFTPSDQSAFTYALKLESGLSKVQVRYERAKITVVLPAEMASHWASTDEVGIYGAVDLEKHGRLDILVEKDFACLDLSDADNKDTFPNPQLDASC
jgi:hypothetical protein